MVLTRCVDAYHLACKVPVEPIIVLSFVAPDFFLKTRVLHDFLTCCLPVLSEFSDFFLQNTRSSSVLSHMLFARYVMFEFSLCCTERCRLPTLNVNNVYLSNTTLSTLSHATLKACNSAPSTCLDAIRRCMVPTRNND